MYVSNKLKRKKKDYRKVNTFFSSASLSVLSTQSSEPIHFEINALNSGLQNRIQRLGVTPFVLFWNLVGHICQRSRADDE